MEFVFQSIQYDGTLPSVATHSAVYKIFDTQGKLIVLDKTSNLAERLDRYYGERYEPLQDLDLREITSRIEFIRTDSAFETLYVLYRERRTAFPKTYRKMRTFPMFPLLKINRKQRFPRIYTSRQIKEGVEYFGPLVTRGQFTRLKTALERTFKLRPCLYNIRGNDPRPDCLYFQMHTCSRPCNNDIDRPHYLKDVQQAIAFIQGSEDALETPLVERMNLFAQEMQFEKAEELRRRIEKIQRARQEIKVTLFSLSSFNFVVILPADSVLRCKLAFVRQGSIVGFETFEVNSLPDALRVYLMQFFEDPIVGTVRREWQYDEFCLVSNFLIDPLPKVDILPVGSLEDVAKLVVDKIQQRKRKKVQMTADSE
jgi:excinuclease ABC subunit C